MKGCGSVDDNCCEDEAKRLVELGASSVIASSEMLVQSNGRTWALLRRCRPGRARKPRDRTRPKRQRTSRGSATVRDHDESEKCAPGYRSVKSGMNLQKHRRSNRRFTGEECGSRLTTRWAIAVVTVARVET